MVRKNRSTTMRYKKRVAAVLLMVCVLALFPLTKPAAAADTLTLDRAVAINDNQIVLEFSEPIAVNLNGSNRGPWCALRIVGDNDTLVWSGGVENSGTALQFPGTMMFVDSKHDKIIWTITPGGVYGADCVTDVLNFEGDLASFSDNAVKFGIEEVPFDQSIDSVNGLLDNVTTTDGKTYLSATRQVGWEAAYVDVEVDSSYTVDLSQTELIDNETSQTDTNADISPILSVRPYNVQEEEQETVVVSGKDPLYIVLWILGGGLVAVALGFGAAHAIGRKAAKK